MGELYSLLKLLSYSSTSPTLECCSVETHFNPVLEKFWQPLKIIGLQHLLRKFTVCEQLAKVPIYRHTASYMEQT